MELVPLYISITAKGLIAYSQTKSLIGNCEGLGKTRMVIFNNNQPKVDTPDKSIWVFTGYEASDYDTLVDGGFDMLYGDVATGNNYTQAQLDKMDTADYTIVGQPTTSSNAMTSFAT